MRICCPHCNTMFDDNPLEEVLNPTISIKKKQCERSSWTEVAEVIRSGRSYTLFDIGDTINFKLKDGTDFSMDVAAMDIYGNNNVVLVATECLPNMHSMNPRSSYGDSGGWSNCEMRKYLNSNILDLFPDDFKEIIIPRTITQKIDGKRYESTDKLWLPSQTEVFQNNKDDADVGDIHFPIFNNEKARVKLVGNETQWWWLRTPSYYIGYFVRYVDPAGSLHSSTAYGSRGVAPACVIG